MEMSTYPVAYQVSYNPIAKLLGIVAYGSGNIVKMVSCFCILDPLKEALPGHIDQLTGFRRNLSYSMGSGRI